jgi:hypothetical protein
VEQNGSCCSPPDLTNTQSFAAYLAPLHKAEWVVYAKRPFGGPEAVLAYLSRYTHRVAIVDSRLIAFNAQGVIFKWKDYRIEGSDRYKRMTLATDEFIRRFLIHVLPKGLHRIRTTACSPKALAPTTSLAPATCSPRQGLNASPLAPPSINASRLPMLRRSHDHHRSV